MRSARRAVSLGVLCTALGAVGAGGAASLAAGGGQDTFYACSTGSNVRAASITINQEPRCHRNESVVSWSQSGQPPVPELISANVDSGAVGDPNWMSAYAQGGWVLEVGCEDGDGEVGRFARLRITSPADAFLTESHVAPVRVDGRTPTIISSNPGGEFVDMIVFVGDGAEALYLSGQTFAPALEAWSRQTLARSTERSSWLIESAHPHAIGASNGEDVLASELPAQRPNDVGRELVPCAHNDDGAR